MNIIGVIPARFGSLRLPGKPLKKILGKPLLQWVLEGASTSKKINELLVATDHNEIYSFVESLGFKAVMTDEALPTGSDRVWQAVKDKNCDIVVNIQGDEPLIQGELLDVLVAPLEEDQQIEMSTLGREMDEESLRSENTAKITLNHQNEALYFSRFPTPYSRFKDPEVFDGCLKHIGLYAYRKFFLRDFCMQSPVVLEQAEGLEQLRALYLGARIKVVKVDHDSWGVDTPEDIIKVEKLLKARGYNG